jgi:DNA polymerase I-like protein with 3'-5' exonuclease and polymerase domains
LKIIVVDFETHYTKTYSLGKMTTEEYVRSPDFEVIGVSVQVGSDEPVWFSGTRKETKEFLEGFDFGSNLALAHNAMFDAAILSWHFDIHPKGWLDTLSMGRALHGTEVGGSLAVLAKHYELGVKGDEVLNALGKRRADFTPEELARYGEYCKNDVALTWGLFAAMSETFPKVELRLIDLTIRMFSEPVLQLDNKLLTNHLEEIKTVKEALIGSLDKGMLMSNPQLAEWLRNHGVEPPMKISPTTGKETYAFAKNDEEFKALLEHESTIVQAAVSARLGAKSTLEETRTQRFIDISQRGPMPVPLRYYAAHTGRWGGDDKLNLQNLPRKSALKHSIVAPIGYVVLDSDSSQIEARTLAWLSGQDDLVQFFELNNQEIAEGVPKHLMQYDPYKIMAAAIYGKAVNAITEKERFLGKQTVLGAGYGMGAKKFQAQLKTYGVSLDEAECQRIIDVYRKTYPQIPKFWRRAQKILDSIIGNNADSFGRDDILSVDGKRGILLPNGLYLKYPNLRRRMSEETGDVEYVYDTKKGKTTVPNHIYGGKVVENVCQALARIIIGEQMLMIAKKYRVVMTVHDAIACIVPEKEADRAKEFVEICMRLRPKWAPDLPLNCEAGYGKSYGHC